MVDSIDIIKKTIEKQKKDKGGKFGAHIVIFGSKGSGKTHYTLKLVKKAFKKPFVYRMTDDFDKEDVYLYPPNNFIEELEKVIEKYIEMAKKKVFDALIIDEADLLFPASKPLNPKMLELVDKCRHFFTSVVFISRRPQNINSFLTEEAHFSIVFAIEGDNVIQKLNRVNKKYGDLVRSLEYKSYKYVFKELGKDPIICDPIKL